MNTKVDECKLISGKDALIALANGQEVQIESNEEWVSVDNCQIYQFLNKYSSYKFRLKPHTIKVELEIPAPFEPKEGEKVYRLAPAMPCGYTEFYFGEDENEWQFGAWRTEEEIKQVVAALRQIFGASHE